MVLPRQLADRRVGMASMRRIGLGSDNPIISLVVNLPWIGCFAQIYITLSDGNFNLYRTGVVSKPRLSRSI